jgi:ribosomal protein L34E
LGEETVQTKEELEQELADVLGKIDKAEKRLRSLRRPPTDVSKGKTRISFITKKEQIAEAAEVMRELDNLRRREPEIRDKLQLHSQELEKRQVIDLEDVTMNEKKVKKPKKQQKKGKGKAKGKA